MMKRYNIYTKVLGLALAALTFAACSDKWDDHYDNKGEGANGASLWQAIDENSNLSNFASVVKACGYDKSLASSQVFTVFAPTNDQFTAEEAQQLIAEYNAEKGKVTEDDNTVIKEFIQNHIALYNHSIAETSNDSLVLMNGKKTLLTGSLFGENTILKKNQHYANGVLFIIQGKAQYFPTVFEYLRKDADLDSIASFFYNSRFYRKEFLPARSVAGGLENGKTVYLDSVFVQQNDLWDYLWAYTNEEDSTYWMVVPTNKEWKKLIEEYEPYFNYDNNVRFRDSLAYTLPRIAIVDGATFSRTLNPDSHLTDSALSTSAAESYIYRDSYWGNKNLHYYQFGSKSAENTQKPFLPTGIFSDTENIECSNGQVMKSDNWKINKLNTFYQWKIYEAEMTSAVREVSKKDVNGESVPTVTAVTRRVSNDNRFYNKVWNNAFVEFQQNYTTQNHTVVFNIDNVLSNIGYDIYLVTAPALANDSNATAAQRIPVKMDCAISYHDQNGESKREVLKSKAVNNPDIVDYILLAEDFKFPTATFGLRETNETQVSLEVKTNVSARELSQKSFDRTLRIDCIMLIPHGIAKLEEDRLVVEPHGDGDSYFWLKQ